MKEQTENNNARLWTKDFILFTLSSLFIYLNLQMITPALPAYIADRFAASSFTISLVVSSFALSAIVARLFAGKALANVSRKKFFVAGLLVYILASAGYYWLGTIALIVLIRIIYGVGFGIVSTTMGTVVSDIVPAKRMGEGMGYFGLSTSLSMSIAPVIGLWLLDSYGFGRLIFISTLLVGVVLLFVPMIRFGSGKAARILQPARASGAGSKKFDFFDKRVLLPFSLNLLLSVTYGGLISFITLFGKENHLANVGWFFLFNAMAVLLVRPFSGKIFDAKGHIAILPAGGLFVIAGLTILSFATSFGMLVVSAVCYGIGYGMIQPSLQAWSIQRVNPERRGVANGMFYNSIDLGIAIGSLALGVIALKLGSYAMMFRLSALFMALFLVIYGLSFALAKRVEVAATEKAAG
ncbi:MULTISPECIES: MFS transporter [unclassified Paenibacillus]|uniref:MFS transporter n=1 Tax=unclassified Paenibacillus TaxID=185978 RepID=UPI001C10FCDC|nr:MULTISPECIES: MFS transporter [unclassified Paenibacillus]MBU5441532.1 MFS transporter [Paenibacillus sp. MSJ-34]CAH0117802.1 putative MFS-type transporter YfcJ [Paenibacillus sp. CECT 9249]